MRLPALSAAFSPASTYVGLNVLVPAAKQPQKQHNSSQLCWEHMCRACSLQYSMPGVAFRKLYC